MKATRTRPQAAIASAVAAVAAFLAAVAAAAAFLPWSSRYEAIYYRAVEMSATARYPQGFLITGALEGTVLALMTATALLAAAAAISANRVLAMRGGTLAFSVIAALLAGTVLPAAVLYGYLAAVPAIAALASIAAGHRTRAGATTVNAAAVGQTRRRT